MSKILDIDLDWLNLCDNHEGSGFLKNRTPEEAFNDLIDRANPDAKMTMSIEHHEAYYIWDAMVEDKRLTKPRHIVHVDEHHDFYDDSQHISCANFMFHALNHWPRCKVTWVAANKAGNDRYFYYGFHQSEMKNRLRTTLRVPEDLNDVDLISLTVSPDYIKGFVLKEILPHIEDKYADRIIGQFPTLRKPYHKYYESDPAYWTMRGVKKS